MKTIFTLSRIGGVTFGLALVGATGAGGGGISSGQEATQAGPAAIELSPFPEAASGETSTLMADPVDCAVEDADFRSAQGGCQELGTLLVWAPAALSSQWTWNQAMSIAADLEAGGYTDWRLPTVAELQHMAADGNYLHLSIDGSSSYGYWSSESKGKKAWGVLLGGTRNGASSLVAKESYRFVLCVRPGAP